MASGANQSGAFFSGRKLAETFKKGQLQIWLRCSCSWAPCIFSRMTGVVPFQIHHFENQLLSSGLFPGQVSAFTSPAGSDSWQRKNGGQVWCWWLCSIFWAPFSTCVRPSVGPRGQARLGPTACTAGCDRGRSSALQMPLPAALGTGSHWNRESWEE